ncbi:DNA internalization-related competence protein ComEC/Rec2 [Shewanella sp. NFH-SH190041]|uniref:DNA internalization-related competence protein ComEC/Rec2 n=1 Tax=Shewanella sp. NFH-SH190041 TaxID=2950245 RepID=UPI0021C44481|nr:DNA internalization-related competence protein ComEC/Rec2 [Shewanella sp. NFH-SH190041]
MNYFLSGFSLALISTLIWPGVPGIEWAGCALLSLVFLRRRLFFAGMAAGSGYFIVFVAALFHTSGSVTLPDRDGRIKVRGEIITSVPGYGDWHRVVLRLQPSPQAPFYVAGFQSPWAKYLQLSWPAEMTSEFDKLPESGQYWRVTLKPKAITSVLNQGGFNRQRYLLSRHIIGQGKVVAAQLLAERPSWRQQLLQQFAGQSAALPFRDILAALLLGDKRYLSAERWQQLRSSGLGHLVAISGLHLSVVSGWLYWLSFMVFSRITPCQGSRNLVLAMLCACGGAVAYAWLAGFALPTQRALIMLLMVLLLLLLRRFASPWERLLYALSLVLLIDPLSVLSGGFWLSFSALAIILLVLQSFEHSNPTSLLADAAKDKGYPTITYPKSEGVGLEPLGIEPPDSAPLNPRPLNATLFSRIRALCHRLVQTGLWQRIGQFIRLQCYLALGLGVVQALLFGALTLHGIWMNLLMVPWLSLVTIPLTLAGGALWFLGMMFGHSWIVALMPAAWSLQPFMALLSLTDVMPGGQFFLAQSTLILVITVLLIVGIWRWVPTGVWRVICLLPVMLVAILQIAAKLSHYATAWMATPIVSEPIIAHVNEYALSDWMANKSWYIHVLDVGQGLAVVIERHGRAVLYDTGAAYGRDFSYAARTIIPFLSARGLSTIDMIIVSHGDNDHAGGLSVLVDAFPTAKLVADNQADAWDNCRPGTYVWQGLVIRKLAPSAPRVGNNGSCVIQVSDGTTRLLLPGDIEIAAETRLLAHYPVIPSQLLLAPHHGSSTSSSAAFIEAVAPELVIFAAGFANQYGFPKTEVVSRYLTAGSEVVQTGISGQISLQIEPGFGWKMRSYREAIAPFWYNKVFAFGWRHNPE